MSNIIVLTNKRTTGVTGTHKPFLIWGVIETAFKIAWIKWCFTASVLSDPQLPIQTKGKAYIQAVRLAILYGFECCPIRSEDEQTLSMKMLH